MMTARISRLHRCPVAWLGTLLLAYTSVASASRVAIIGGGISGTFSAKYLVDYDQNCSLELISIFDPLPIGEPIFKDTVPDEDWQGSRVASLHLTIDDANNSHEEDPVVVELGASVGLSDFRLVVDMIQTDPAIQMGHPHHTGNATRDARRPAGMGIYDGNGVWSMLTRKPSLLSKLQLLLRYNVDLWRVSRAAAKGRKSFRLVHYWLEQNHPSTFFHSPTEMVQAAGLHKPSLMSFDELLNAIGLSQQLPWWRTMLPFQGSLRAELLTAVNLCNYNQANSQLNGLVGLGSFVSSDVKLFSVVGGNAKIIKSALMQAQTNRQKQCQDDSTVNTVQHERKRVATVVGDVDGMELFDVSGQSLGRYDVVLLAAPIQQSRISFLIKSDKDAAVLHDMPLGDRINPEDVKTHEGHEVLPTPLPPLAARPFTQVVTTVVSNCTLRPQHFSLLDEERLPRSILMTEHGRVTENNITAISQLTDDGIYKIFSSDALSESVLAELFGQGSYKVEYVKVWGGQYGGATPDFQGEGKTMPYLLYDSGLKGTTEGGALYYPNAIETLFACMELSAVGAKSVAKLVARRLGLLQPVIGGEDDAASSGEEL